MNEASFHQRGRTACIAARIRNARNGRCYAAPVWNYVISDTFVPLLDPVIPQEEFKFEAERAHATVIELESSHAIPVTFPEVVIDVIKQAARAIADEP